jgi:hypothetical protein
MGAFSECQQPFLRSARRERNDLAARSALGERCSS